MGTKTSSQGICTQNQQLSLIMNNEFGITGMTVVEVLYFQLFCLVKVAPLTLG
ncbi:MAG: hypothetical protein ACFFBV_15945 [Promethearchaeota archaeon]